QAEDGIRDKLVTGVQTCALPIFGAVDPSFNTIAEVLPKAAEEMKAAESELKGLKADSALSPEQRALKLLQEAEQQYELQVAQQRSEERRVGKECRSRWGAYE